MKKSLVMLSVLFLLPVAHAVEKGENWEAKKQEQFARLKEVKLDAAREKISLMQEAASCIQSAQSQDAMRSCDERERSAMEGHQRRMKERWESLKQK